MSMYKYAFSHILRPTDEFAQEPQTDPCGPTRLSQCHVTHPGILPHAGHSAPHQPPSQSFPQQMDWRHGANTEGEWSSRNHLSSHQVAPTSLAELPIPTISRARRPSERASEEEYQSKVLGVTLKAHKSKGTKEAQERRNRNAQALRRSRTNKDPEKAELIRKEQEMKQERDDARAELQREREISQQERERTRQAEAEIERLRRENEELKQRK
ncbi:hypothetical protein E4U19_005407 [Claviceps sp. Clav32 group G5]|nr:hypothetical protein E4U19_005407 [Claviceps sp. Clav32 group G5]